jgi:hypothetical protein
LKTALTANSSCFYGSAIGKGRRSVRIDYNKNV